MVKSSRYFRTILFNFSIHMIITIWIKMRGVKLVNITEYKLIIKLLYFSAYGLFSCRILLFFIFWKIQNLQNMLKFMSCPTLLPILLNNSRLILFQQTFRIRHFCQKKTRIRFIETAEKNKSNVTKMVEKQ